MPLWGSNDAASNSTIFAAAQVKVAPNTANRDALFGNTTANAYFDGVTVGQYGVSADEVTAGGGAVAHSGWVLRTVGQGGRAGRVMTEVLVAGGITGDASDDAAFPDYTILINTQPTNATANSADDEQATFTVVASTIPTGGTLSYQWTYANGDTLGVSGYAGATTDTLTVDSNTASNGESYIVEIGTTGASNVVSDSATITITT
jgi:hypothetical protein